MLDFTHLPNAQNGAEIQVFSALGLNDWQTWQRPRSKSMAMITMVGGGSGGGGGYSGSAGTARGGGGGAVSGSIHKLLVPLDLVADTLFIRVPLGGVGGAPGASGSPGTLGLVSVRPEAITQQALVASYTNAAMGGSGGNNSTAASAGISCTSYTLGLGATWGYLACASQGNLGGAGGAPAGAVGTTIAPYSTMAITGGGGGAGVTTTEYAGGGITGAGLLPSVAGPAAGGISGSNGFFMSKGPLSAWYGVGGTGGSSSNTGTGGNGGNGGLGCGGGGGGAGMIGGSGGSGGHGFVVIVSW